MRDNPLRRFFTVPFLCLLLATSAPWLMVYAHHREWLDLALGALIAFLLAFVGTVLSERAAARRCHALVPAAVRISQRREVRRRPRRIW